MSNLIVVGFNNAADAFQMRAALGPNADPVFDRMEDAVVVTRDAGAVAVASGCELSSAGVASGAFWGTLTILIPQPAAGRRRGRRSPRLVRQTRRHRHQRSVQKDLGATLTAGSAALFRARAQVNPDKVLEGLKPFAGKGRVLQTSLTKDKEDELRKFMEGA
jgi:uncharacterized membrane protein